MNTFEITIQRKSGNAWPIVIRHQTDEYDLITWAYGSFELDLQKLIPISSTSKEYGTLLGKALFRDDIRDTFVQAMSSQQALRVLLIIEAEDLRILHWEQLCAPFPAKRWDSLLLNQQTLFSLYMPSQIERRFPPIGRRDLYALLLVAGPEQIEGNYELAEFDVPATVSSIRNALGGIPCDVFAPIAEAKGQARLDTLCEQLTRKKYTLLHIICHGRITRDTNETMLFFPKDKSGKPVTGTELITRLSRINTAYGLPHFIYLSTCHSADPQAENGLGGLGQRLVRELGTPAVLAMTDRISIATAEALGQTFYTRLKEHGEVDRALTEALTSLPGKYDVTVPALFSRLGGRPLFSDTLDRPLTNAEIGYGLKAATGLIEQHAPILLKELQNAATTLQSNLDLEPAALAESARVERSAALGVVNNLCNEALDISFNALALGRKAPAYNTRCPFKGLEPFRAEDRDFFFGRETLVNKLVRHSQAHNFLAILGPSGSGKSSVVLAGLLPKLEADATYLTPGSDPILQLENALNTNQPAKIIVIDQFEELFTQCTNEEKRLDFINRILKLAQEQRVILTMRADFWGECATYRNLAEQMLAHQELVAPMDAAELRHAIENQAAHVGLRFEAGLAASILDDVQGEPGAMPLLQHALLLLWNRRHGLWLRRAEYDAFGGVRQAVAATAEDVYTDPELTDLQRKQIRNIFIRLTRLDDEESQPEKRRDTRRRLTLSDLTPVVGDPEKTVLLVKRLADSRLVTTSLDPVTKQQEVEVAHEAILRYWPRLRSWLDEDRAFWQQQQKINQDAKEWQADKSARDSLYRGKKLKAALEWHTNSQDTINASELEFLAASKAAYRRFLIRQAVLGAAAILLLGIMTAIGPGKWILHRALHNRTLNISPVVNFSEGEIVFGTDDPYKFPEEPDLVYEQVGDFDLEAYEVTNKKYRNCVDANVCEPPRDRRFFDSADFDEHPVVFVTSEQAETYCAWLGRRLPTTYEWELAARGYEGNPWPWFDASLPINSITPEHANVIVGEYFPEGTQPVGKYPADPNGIFDLVGNVWEWTSTPYEDPSGSAEMTILIARGGSWDTNIQRITEILILPFDAFDMAIGFRCAQTTKGE